MAENKAFANCVQCGQTNDGGFDSCKSCTIEECRHAIKQLNWLLNHFAKVVKAAKKWQLQKEIADENPPRLLSCAKGTAEECTKGYDEAAKVMEEYSKAKDALVDSLKGLDKEGIKVKC